MKFQFSVRTLLLATAVAGIWMGGIVAAHRTLNPKIGPRPVEPVEFWLLTSAVLTPFWAPAVFLGYAFGRRSLTPWTLIALGVAEALALCATWLSLKYLSDF